VDVAAFAILTVGLALFAVLAGADLGVGVLLLVAAMRGEDDDQQDLLAYFTPRWEVHGVLMVFFSTGLFAAFPRVLAELGTALIAPVLGALALLVVRSAAYVALHAGLPRSRRLAAMLFGASSAGAAGLLGLTAAAPAAGAVRHGVLLPEYATDRAAIAAASVSVLAATHLAAAAVSAHTRRRGRSSTDRFGLAAAATGLAAFPVGGLAVAAIADHDTRLHERLLGPYGLAVALGGALVLAGIAQSMLRRPLPALALAAAGYATVLASGAFAIYPYVVYPTLTVGDSAAPAASVSAFLAGTAVGGPIVVVALAVLQLGTFRRGRGAHPAHLP
jgi:cytochrome d ubiquinol oxidase subunit II